MSIIAIVQARMGSTRLKAKVLRKINGVPLIKLLLLRLSKSTLLDKIIVATTSNKEDIELKNYVESIGYDCEIGSEKNVMDRYIKVGVMNKAKIIVRITGDCPLIDPQIVDKVISEFTSREFDYVSNISPPTFPDGLDVEVFKLSSLIEASNQTSKLYDLEHVTPYFRDSGYYTTYNIKNKKDYSHIRLTVDELIDLNVIKNIFTYFHPNYYFSWTDIIDLHKKEPNLFTNHNLQRNEGANMGSGQKLWKRAKEIIPGGNMLLSKRPEMFLPDEWPSYFSKAKGCKVWDLDGVSYTDMSIMGIGTNILGYANEEVDQEVVNTVKSSNMSTLNCPEEVYLVEKLIEMHPWADMGRLARSGGEANAIAIRIARAASKNDNVAICGYHGWHDWYLAANLKKDELGSHLIPGLEPNGVPENLRDTVYPFKYNCFEELEDLVNTKNIGIIKMEVLRGESPKNNFLKKVRDLATKKNIILIFDECTSGFRETFGGIHKKFEVDPDMAMFGKAMGNGYAITAVIGKKEIMQSAQSSFISSTFWTERIGPTAALKTIEIMNREKTWEYITRLGLYIRDCWQLLADKHGLEISVWGIPSLSGFNIKSTKFLEYKTFITQEMLKNGFLAGNCIYVCKSHNKEIVDEYMYYLDSIFKILRECEDGRDINKLLKNSICHSGFKRLN